MNRNVTTYVAATAAVLSALVVGGAQVARAAQVTGLLVDNYSTSYPLRQPSKTFNGNATEDSTTFSDNWMTNSVSNGFLTWSLNGRYTLDSINSIKVFNYREGASAARSAKDVVLSVSNDYGATFTVIPSNGGTIPATLAQAPTSGTNTPTTFSTGSIAVTNVKLQINNSYADASFVGLNEVEFFGTAARATTQVPITVSAVSSQYTPDGRLATNTVDGNYETLNPTQMWLSNGADNLPKISYSLGSRPMILDHLNIWNYNEQNFQSRGLNTIQIMLLNSVGADIGLAINDADGSTTFTLNEPTFNAAFGNAVLDGNSVMDTLGIRNATSAYGFRIETLTNPNGSGFGGLSEVQVFVAPEPASMSALTISASVLMVSRRKRIASLKAAN